MDCRVWCSSNNCCSWNQLMWIKWQWIYPSRLIIYELTKKTLIAGCKFSSLHWVQKWYTEIENSVAKLQVWLCPCIKLLWSLFSWASMPSKSIALRYQPKLSLFQNAGHADQYEDCIFNKLQTNLLHEVRKNVHFSTCAPNVSYWLSLARISAKPLNQISRKSAPLTFGGMGKIFR